MYNFVSKPELLPISKTTNVHHFYQFQGKQMKEKQLEEKKKLDDLLAKIEQEQQKEKEKITKSQPNKINPVLNDKDSQRPQAPKSYFIDIMSSKHSSKQNHPNSTKSFNNFYQKNKRWKENVEAEILRKKQQKIQRQERELSQCRKPLSEKDLKSQNINLTKNSNSLHHAFDSKGPISGWTQRFHEYINKRLPQCPEVEFKPTINKKSKIIAGKMVGKVEDRLIRFGEILKMRKHEMIIEEAGKIGKLPGSQVNHYASINTNHSDLFFRLFKEGQKTNRRVKQLSEKKEFSFKPSISRLPQNMEKKVQEKREKSPLYTAKKFTKQETQRLLELYTKQTGKTYSEVEFQNFMKRNQMLLDKKIKNVEQKVKDDLLREEKQFQECTFIPLLNPRSIRMFDRTEQNEKSQNQDIDYEYSHDELPLEESPQQLFTSQKKSGQKADNKSHSKYSYPHSYTEPVEDFEYEIHTPSKYELSNSGLSNTKSPNVNKLNEISQMDSLEFSGQKHHFTSNIFNKNTHEKSAQKSRDQNEVINYQLTFSNKKLTQELSEINNIEENQIEAQITINQNQPKTHNYSSKSERELIEYNEKKEQLENSWENELERVKNRLQTLMKNSGKNPQSEPHQWK